MATWINGRKSKLYPPIDTSDFPKKYFARFAGDDPHSGWVDTAMMTAEEIRECNYDDYWEWLDESESLTPLSVEEAAKIKSDLIWEMIMENQDADDDTFTKQDIEVALYGWLEKVDPKSQRKKPSTPIPSDIVQALEAANPYPHMEDLPWDPASAKSGYYACLSKLRELLSSLPQNQKGEHKCMRCTSEYNIDLIIPDGLWLKISPKPIDGFKSGGLLCGSCIMQILEKELGQAFVLHVSTMPAAPVDILLNALNKIVNPIKHMREDLKEGEQLHGQYAIQLSNDPEYLKSIAREALQEFNSGNQTEKEEEKS